MSKLSFPPPLLPTSDSTLDPKEKDRSRQGPGASKAKVIFTVAGLGLVPAFLVPGWWSWVALGLVGVWLLVNRKVNGGWWKRTTLDWPVFLVLFATSVGLVCSLDFSLSASRAWSLIGGLVTYYVVVNSSRGAALARNGGWVLACLAFGVGLVGLVAADWGRGDLLKLPFIYDHLPHLLDGSFGSGASGETEINPRVIAGALAMLIPVVWATFLAGLRAPARAKTKGLGLIGLLIIGLFTSFVLGLSQSPTALGGLVVAAFLFYLLRSLGLLSKRLRVLFTGVIAFELGAIVALSALALPAFLSYLPPASSDPTQRIVFRLEMWRRSFDMFGDKPFSGIGLNNFPISLYDFYPTFSLGPEAHAHNLLLQTALDGGVVGLAAFICLLWGLSAMLYRAWGWQDRNTGRSARFLVAGVSIGTIAWLFYGTGEAITLGHKPAVILWAMWGMVAVPAGEREKGSAKKDKYSRMGLITQNRFSSFLARKKYKLLILLLLGLGLLGLMFGGGWTRLKLNIALVEAQRVFLDPASGTALTRAREELGSALGRSSFDSAPARDLAARLAIQAGDVESAVENLRLEIGLDSNGTVSKYIPALWDWWRPGPVGKGLSPQIMLYTQWKNRYPTDPISYARLALAYQNQCERAQAESVLREGLGRLSPDETLLLKTLLTQLEGC